MEAALTAAGVVAFYGGLGALAFVIGEALTLGWHVLRQRRRAQWWRR